MGSIWWIVESLKKSYCWISAREMLWHALLIFYKKVTRSFAPYCQAKMDKVNCNLCISSQICRSKNKTRRTRTVLFHIHARPITRKTFQPSGAWSPTWQRIAKIAHCWIFMPINFCYTLQAVVSPGRMLRNEERGKRPAWRNHCSQGTFVKNVIYNFLWSCIWLRYFTLIKEYLV